MVKGLDTQGEILLQRLLSRFSEQYTTKEDLTLLQLVFSPSPTQQMLDNALRICDIEALGAGKSILLSYLMHGNPTLYFPDDVTPRLKGLILNARFANMKTLSHFSRIGRAYNTAGIPILLIKGGAFKVLRPTLSRPMGDVDVLIPKKRFAEAIKIGEKLGYLHDREDSLHAVDFHTETESAVDVHHSLFDPGKPLDVLHENLWERATPHRAFGVDFLLPCHEDHFFLVLANFTKNLREQTSLGNLYYALCDTTFLYSSKVDFDWGIVWDDAVASGREIEIRFAAEFMNKIVPGIIPNMETNFPITRGMQDFCTQVIFDEDFYLRRQRDCQSIRVVDLKNHPQRYGKQIIKFILLKKLRRIPAFVRWYLQVQLAKEVNDAHR